MGLKEVIPCSAILTRPLPVAICGHGGHEGEEGFEDRPGQDGKVRCVPREQGEDHRGPAEDRLDEEQDREGREQEGPRQWQEGLRPHQGWTTAVQKARKALGVKGFQAVKKGSPLYKKAKEIYGQ